MLATILNRWLFGCMLLWCTAAAAAISPETPSLPPDTLPVTLAPGQKVFPYRNPVYPGAFPEPAILRVGEYVYAAATGERIMRSRDLAHWETVGTLFSAGKPTWVDPITPDIWAPDLNYIDGKYVLYFSARAAGYADIHRGVGVAWADKPQGPYHPEPLPLAVGPGFRNIDPMAFQDDDGKRYLYWGSAGQPILVQELSADGLSLVGQPQVALEPDLGIRYSKLVEGTWVIKRGDYYYIFWSGDGYHPGQYAVSVARATSPFGPFTRYSANPILKESVWWTSPGHNALIRDDAGQDWLVYHAYDTSDTELGRMLLIDQLIWKDGWPTIKQRIPSTQTVSDGPIWNTSAIPLVEVAAGKLVTSSSAQEGKPAVKALDNNTYTGWAPEEGDVDNWLCVDLGEQRRVAQVDLRFRKASTGDYHYMIETSSDGKQWQVFADRTDTSSTYPYVQTNEATARYVRISRLSVPPGASAVLYEMRVFAYDQVFIANPDSLAPVSGPIPLRVTVDDRIRPQSVSVHLDGQPIYKGGDAPAHPIDTLELADGPHQLTLQVIDTNQTLWQHDLQFWVSNCQITAPRSNDKLKGTVQIRLFTGYDADMLQSTTVELIPVQNGERQSDAAVILHTSEQWPAELDLDTTHVADGAYDLQFTCVSRSGSVSRSVNRVLVKNWDWQIDEFTPPIAQGWFGLVDRKQTSYESSGWDYDTTDPALFWGDDARRVWRGNGTGQLIWNVPGLRRFSITLYAKADNLAGFGVSAAASQEVWQPVTVAVIRTDMAGTPWRRFVVSGELANPGNLLRLDVPATLQADQFQLGQVEIAVPSI